MRKRDNIKLDVISGIDEKIIDEATDTRITLSQRVKRAAILARRKWIALGGMAAGLLLICTLLLTFLWPAVGPGVGTQIPVYRGMTIIRNTPSLAEAQVSDGLGLLLSNDPTALPVSLKGKPTQQETSLKEHIKDIVNIDVESEKEVKYYVEPGETFIIAVHISNPEDYEIQSFTLNGKKYVNYMFKEGSTMETLLLEVTAPETPGYMEYTIDAIKYIDGTEIKDIDMSSGDKSIAVGITYPTAPSAEIVSKTVTTTTLQLSIRVSDPCGVIGANELSVYLSDGERIVDKKPLQIGNNTVSFSGLRMSKTYEYGIVAVYDLADGRDIHQEWLGTEKLTTPGAFTVDHIRTEKETISFEINRIGETGSITSVSLYDAATGTQVQTATPDTRHFEGLLSDHTYDLYVHFAYTVKGETVRDQIVVTGITTMAKTAPTLTFGGTASDQTSVTYSLKTEDPDRILNVTKVELFKDGKRALENGKAFSGSFQNLLSGTEYTVKVTYTYNLNDGSGDQTKTVTKDITTIAKTAPTLTFGTTSPDQTSVTYSLKATDPDSILNITVVELFKGSERIEENGKAMEGTFKNLLSNTEYTVKVTYTYNLNDGSDDQTKTVTKDITTAAKTAPTLNFGTTSSDQTSVTYSLKPTDPDRILNVTKVELLQNGVLMQSNETDLNGKFASLLSGIEYTVKVTYTYNLNDGNGDQTEVVTKNITTVTKTAPTLTFGSTASDQTSVTYSLKATDPDSILNITKVELFKGTDRIGDNGKLLESSFQNLLSGTGYTVKVTYTYNLNDGNGDQTKAVTKDITTAAKTAPTLNFGTTSSDQTSVTYSLKTTDSDSILNITAVELFKGSERIEENGKAMEGTFKNLLSNTEYTVKVTYTYNLNDGSDDQTKTVTKDITTVAKTAPTLTFDTLTSDKVFIQYKVNANDPDAILNITKVELFKDDKYVLENGKLLEGAFQNLLSNTKYTVKVTYTYNLNDGNGDQTEVVTKDITTVAKTAPTLTFGTTSSDQTSVTYSLKPTDPDRILNVTKVELLQNGVLMQSNEVDLNGIFASLLSGIEYTVKVTYTYNLNDGNGDQTKAVTKNITTVAKTAPVLTFDTLTSDKVSIQYKVNANDPDAILNITVVELFKGSERIEENGKAKEGTFKNLLSNTEYIVKVTYTYNLNDGNGDQTEVVTKEITTAAKTAPSVTFGNIQVTDASIIGTFDMEDVDLIGEITSVALCQNGTEVQSSATGQIDFSELASYTDYRIVISYAYDLNDGMGIQTGTASYDVKTLPRLIFNSFSVINTSAVSEGEIIVLQVNITNPNRVTYQKLVINGQEYPVLANSSTETLLYCEILNNGQFAGGYTTLTIEKVIAELDGTLYTVEPEANHTSGVFINGTLEVTDLYVVVLRDGTYVKTDYVLPRDEVYVRIELFNKTGYRIDSVAFTPSNTPYPTVYTNLIRLDDEHYLIPVTPERQWNEYILTEITYSREGFEKTGTTKLRYILYQATNDQAHLISSAEDLLNTTFDGGYYELTCDIDLSGMEWNAKQFRGVLNGNGYSILNMSFVGTITNRSAKLGLFSEADGVIQNLHLKNVRFIVEHTVTNDNYYNLQFGGIAAASLDGLIIDHCTLDENSFIKVNAHDVGGLVGEGFGDVVIKNCINYATVIGTGSVGGIIADAPEESLIENCENYGNVSGESWVGGIVGIGSGTLLNCVNHGTVSGKENIAGIAGANGGPMVYCINNGDVYCSLYSSGITGHISRDSYMPTTMTACVNLGKINDKIIDGDLFCIKDQDVEIINCHSIGQGTPVEELSSKAFYTDVLHFDESIWDLDDLDIENGKYPKLKH